MIEFKCRNCGAPMSAPDSRAGQTGTCPACNSVAGVPVPQSGPSLPEAQEPVPPAPPVEQPATEKVLFSGRPSHWAYLANFVVGPIIMAGGGVLLALTDVRDPGGYALASGVILFGLSIVAWALLDRAATRFEVTTRTVSLRRGILWRKVIEILTRSVCEIRLNQDPIGRMANVGKLGFSSASTSEVEIVYWGVPDPDSLRRLVREYSAL